MMMATCCGTFSIDVVEASSGSSPGRSRIDATGPRPPGLRVPWSCRSCPLPRRTFLVSSSRRCSARRSSSSEINLLVISSRTSDMESRRTLRMATLASSTCACTCLTSCLRRSSVELRNGEANHHAVAGRGDANVGFLQGALDVGNHALVPWLDHQQARLWRRNVGHLIERSRRAVVLDGDAIEERRRGATGANRVQIAMECID